MASASKNAGHTSGSTSLTSSGPYVCADLLDSLLHEIIVLINSFHDFLAFTGTCRSWRTAVSSFPSVYTFSFPPLHLKPDGPYVRPHSRGFQPLLLSNCKWQLSDPCKKNLSCCCSVPQNTPDTMHYLGCSYGYLIFTYEEDCLLVDAYTGAKVKTPNLPCDNELGFTSGIGILTAPLSSPNSCLLLFSRASMFEWQVGTNSWSVHPFDLDRERIHQIVSFKGHILVIDALMRLHSVQLTPQFRMQEIAIMWRSLQVFPVNPWLVACGDMLLMVELSYRSVSSFGLDDASRIFEVFRLDFSVEPAKWVKMEKLENQALFVSYDKRNPAFSCMNPERWGGKSNCIYVARLFDDQDEAWTAVELGELVRNCGTCHNMMYSFTFPPDYSQIGSLWLFPSLVYGASQ
uniref:KIB1-4 beta-propeller domain-containing protein n=1 Tax=Setaria italica TaxID=4555 RepID=K3Y7R6_SETIT